WKGVTMLAHDNGTISLIRMEAFIRYSAAGEIKLQQGLGPIAYDPTTHRFIVAAKSASGGAELLFLSH
ncbi:MAG: hypothetical protein KGL21_05035, partial [Alphaproteobacteria bacterium]|nr:hypothetical protein [Alphaproteobacteria bacterium]